MFAIELFAAVFLILVITSLILNLWIYRSVVTPLNKLKLATHNIQAGNFDFEMPNVPKNEIGDVCRDFEEMRVIFKAVVRRQDSFRYGRKRADPQYFT